LTGAIMIAPLSSYTRCCGVEDNTPDCRAWNRMAWTAFMTSPGWL
jgi:hypothetical protein